MAAIVIGIGGFVVFGESLVMLLEGCPALVLVVLGQALFRARIVADAAWATAEGDVAVAGDEASFDTPVIREGVVDVAVVHMHDHGVVVEVVAAPLSAGKAKAAVAEAVVHAAVVAHVLAPVSFMEAIPATFPAPVGGRPQRAIIRGGHPGAGNPVVALVAVGPVTGGPHHAGLHAGGLLVDRQRRRRNADDDLCASKRGCGNENDNQRQQKTTGREQKSHKILHFLLQQAELGPTRSTPTIRRVARNPGQRSSGPHIGGQRQHPERLLNEFAVKNTFLFIPFGGGCRGSYHCLLRRRE
jgi:hypothetical protein